MAGEERREVVLHHLFLRFWGNFSPVWLAPSQWMLDLGGDGKPPDLLAALMGCGRREGRRKKSCRKSTNPGGKTPKLEEEHQTCPQEGFFRGDGDGEAVV